MPGGKKSRKDKGHQWEFTFDVDVQWGQPTRGITPALFHDLPEHAAEFHTNTCARDFDELEESFASGSMAPTIGVMDRRERNPRELVINLTDEEMERVKTLQHDIQSMHGVRLSVDELVILALNHLTPSVPVEKEPVELVTDEGSVRDHQTEIVVQELLLIG